jgi:uncharacterized membrane protein
MKKIFTFVKDRIITGMLVIIPIVVIGVILKDVIKKLMVITTPLSSKMSFAGPLIETIIAGIILVIFLGGFFFISGVFFKTYLGNRFENWLEKKILGRVPFYETIRGVSRHISGVEKGKYSVVEVDLYANTNKVLGLLTETLSDGRCVVYIPFAPFINIGQVHIIAKEKMKKLDISLKDANEIISRFGFEADKVYKK